MNKYTIVSAIIEKDGKYLIGKRALSKKFAPGKWEFISGFLEKEESPENTILREIEEELGVKSKIIKKLAPYFYEDDEGEWTIIPIITKLENDNPKINTEDHSDLRWVTKEEIKNIAELREDYQILKERGII